jgi:hypothetical protein
MSDVDPTDAAEGLLRLALEFWCRSEGLPEDLRADLQATPREVLAVAWERIVEDAV